MLTNISKTAANLKSKKPFASFEIHMQISALKFSAISKFARTIKVRYERRNGKSRQRRKVDDFTISVESKM